MSVQGEQYVCAGWQLPDGDNYIVEFQELASESSVYMMLYGCARPAEIKTAWKNCRRACSSESIPLISWTKYASPVTLPANTGFAIGGKTSIAYLVLQVHYQQSNAVERPVEEAGFRIAVTPIRPHYVTGLFVMALEDLVIPAMTKNVYGDISCQYDDDAELNTFAFRVHAHKLGQVVSGYLVDKNGSWHLLGHSNPQWPQAYYPVKLS